EKKTPGRLDNVFRALTDVRPSQLADQKLFDFASLGARDCSAPDAGAWLLGDADDVGRTSPESHRVAEP
ncbi:MAG TPA: tRNA 2-thiocytidine(32) synthetase TtcA, partial [Xanthomonadales bacterium]|nr:tRNA 2-thiocytidine(32) synthetase TtcA [Xanthomonadales bacterium]